MSKVSDFWRRQSKQRRLLGVIIGFYLLIGLSYLWATPPLESSDEYKHYPVVQHFQTTGSLPVLDPAAPGRWLQAAAQPPLYYMLMALVTWGIDTDDLAIIHETNRYVFVGDTRHDNNKNIIIPAQEGARFPLTGAATAIYLIRFVSLLLGVGTIWLTYQLGWRLAGPDVGLLAAALTAFNPMFLFISAAVNNDSLAALLGALGIYLLVRLGQERPDPAERPGLYLLVGAVIGLGALTKLSLAGLGLVAALIFVSLAWSARDLRRLIRSAVLGAAPALFLITPMLWRNYSYYGDLTGLSAFIAVQGVRETPITWADWLSEFGTFYRTFWGLFGGLNIAAPNWFYGLANGAVIAALAGHLRFAVARAGGIDENDRFRWRAAWPLLLWLLILFTLLVRWTIIYQSFQGRLIFPGLSSFNVVWAAGLWRLLAGLKDRPRFLAAVAGLAAIMAAALPWTTIGPAYRYPEPVALVPADHQFGPIRFAAGERTIQLVGVAMTEPETLQPAGRPLRVTLYWQADGPTERDYLSAVSLLGYEGETVARINRHPASGAVPTSRWEAGQIWRDEYDLFVDEAAFAPVRLTVRVALYDPAADADLPTFDPAGNPLAQLTIGAVRLAAPAPAELPAGTKALFAGGLELLAVPPSASGSTAGNTATLTLYWRVIEPLPADYTVFIHLLDNEGAFVMALDGPPVNGFYPTSLWRSGDVVPDSHLLQLPAELSAGNYELAVGLYDPLTGERLLLRDGGDHIRLPVVITAQ